MTEIIALSSNQKWQNECEKRKGEKGATGRHLGGAGGDRERKNGMNGWMERAWLKNERNINRARLREHMNYMGWEIE
jgi:hypothetical protein